MSRRKVSILVGAAAAVAVCVVALGLSGVSHATSPCRPATPETRTGLFVEVLKDGVPVPSTDPIVASVPRAVCVTQPAGVRPGNRLVVVTDCYDSSKTVRAELAE
jgi:hypothetical protein